MEGPRAIKGRPGKKGAEKLVKEVFDRIAVQIPIQQDKITRLGSKEEVGLEHKLDGWEGLY